jgi:hypothetical protein
MIDIRLKIGAWINKNRFATREQVQRRFALPQSTTFKHLNVMVKKGLINSVKPRETKTAVNVANAYHSTSKLINLLIARSGSSVDPMTIEEERIRRRGYSGDFLLHELNVTEIILSMELSIKQYEHLGYKLLFYERDGRGDTEVIAQNPDADSPKRKLTIRSDILFGIQNLEGRTAFFFVEMDNGRMNRKKMAHKYLTLKSYANQNGFHEKRKSLIPKYSFDANEFSDSKAGFRVLTVATSTTGEQTEIERRNQLLKHALDLKGFTLFWFTTLGDATAKNFFSDIWIRGKEYTAVSDTLRGMKEQWDTWSKSQRKVYREKEIEKMPRVRVLDAVPQEQPGLQKSQDGANGFSQATLLPQAMSENTLERPATKMPAGDLEPIDDLN